MHRKDNREALKPHSLFVRDQLVESLFNISSENRHLHKVTGAQSGKWIR